MGIHIRDGDSSGSSRSDGSGLREICIVLLPSLIKTNEVVRLFWQCAGGSAKVYACSNFTRLIGSTVASYNPLSTAPHPSGVRFNFDKILYRAGVNAQCTISWTIGVWRFLRAKTSVNLIHGNVHCQLLSFRVTVAGYSSLLPTGTGDKPG